MKCRLCIAVAALFALASCDILRNGAFEVSGWNPGSGYHDPAAVEVALAFSHTPDRNSVERSFLLNENGQTLPGHFFWRGNQMIFNPSAPLMANKEYLITLKTDAQDVRGLNLERQFEAAFTTRPGGERPVVLATVPEEGGIIVESRGRVELFFSQPMNRSSLQSLSFSPSVSGVWALEQGGCLAVFTPQENWVTGRSYRLTVGNAAADETELEAGRDFSLHFSVGFDRSAPELLSAFALDTMGRTAMILAADTAITDGMVTENSGWERSYRLTLAFSEPVDSTSVQSALGLEPSLGMTLETSPGFSNTLVYRFIDDPAFGVLYTITLEKTVKDGVGNTMEQKIRWHIRADGENSKPLLLRGLRFPKAPSSVLEFAVYRPEDLFADFPIESGNYSFDRGVNTWMELYFETAPGASIDPLSLMDRFKFSATNGAVHFSPRTIVLSSFTAALPVSGWEHFRRVEIRGVLTNHPYTGMVTIETGAGLKDSLGNKTPEAQRFLLLK
jgi:hypothetical protein